MNPQVCLLTTEQVSQYWERIEWRIDATPQLERFYTKEDMIDKVCKSEMQIWTAGDDLVLATVVLVTPVGKVLQIVWAHGTGIMLYWEELKEKFHRYAWFAQCKKIEVLGRPGWTKRFLNEGGFRIEYVAYSCDVLKPVMH